MWHLPKNVAKKLAKKAKTKSIVVSFSCESNLFLTTFGGLLKHAMMMCSCSWKSIVHHISSAHKWDSDPNVLFPKCVHPTLSPEDEHSKKWLRPESDVHNALCKVALQNTGLKIDWFPSYRLVGSFPFLIAEMLSKMTAFLA